MTRPKPKPAATQLWDLLAKIEDGREAAVQALATRDYPLLISVLTGLRMDCNEALELSAALRTEQERAGEASA